MNKWEEEFQHHVIFSVLADVLSRIQSLKEATADAEALIILERLGRLSKKCQTLLQRADTGVSSTRNLDDGNAHLTNAQAELSAYASDNAVSRLPITNQHLENTVQALIRLPQIESAADVKELQEAMLSFRRSVSQHARNVQEENEAISTQAKETKTRLEETKGEIQLQKTRLDEAISQFQQQFSTAEETRRQQAQEAVTKLQTQSTEIQEKFNANQEARNERFNENLVAVQKQLDDSLVALQKIQASAEEGFRAQAAQVISELETRKTEAEKILGAIAQTGMAGGYQRVANREKMTMYLWQGITVAAIIGFILVLCTIVTVNSVPAVDASIAATMGFSWPALIKRVLISLAFGALAAYAGKEAAKASEKERHYRKLELEIASIGPFLATLPKEKQDTTLQSVATRLFAADADKPLNVEEAAASTNGLIDILKMAMEALAKKGK